MGLKELNTPALLGIFVCSAIALQQLAQIGSTTSPPRSTEKRVAEAHEALESKTTDKCGLQRGTKPVKPTPFRLASRALRI